MAGKRVNAIRAKLAKPIAADAPALTWRGGLIIGGMLLVIWFVQSHWTDWTWPANPAPPTGGGGAGGGGGDLPPGVPGGDTPGMVPMAGGGGSGPKLDDPGPFGGLLPVVSAW